MPLSFKMIGAGLLLTFVGFFMSLSELRLTLFGTRVKAEIVDGGAWVKASGEVKSFELQYRFRDDKGQDVTNGVTVGADFPITEAKVDVFYIKGNSSINKLASKSGWKSYLALIAGIALTALGGWYFTQESVNEAHAETAATMDRMKRRSLPGRLGLD